MTAWNVNDWKIDRKTAKELQDKPFDGARDKYMDWHELMRNHVLSTNHGYGRLIYEIEQQMIPLTFT